MKEENLTDGLTIRCPKSDKHKITIVDKSDTPGSSFYVRI